MFCSAVRMGFINSLRSMFRTKHLIKIYDVCREQNLFKALQVKPMIQLASSAFIFTIAHCEPCGPIGKLQFPDSKELTYEQLLRNACVTTAGASSNILTLTVAAIMDMETQYRNSMDKLIALLEESMTVPASNQDYQNKLWDKVVSARARMEDEKKALLELKSFLNYVEGLITKTAETSFLVGSDYVSSTLCERLTCAQNKCTQESDKTKKKEMELRSVEETFIKKMGEWQRMNERKNNNGNNSRC